MCAFDLLTYCQMFSKSTLGAIVWKSKKLVQIQIPDLDYDEYWTQLSKLKQGTGPNNKPSLI